MKPLRGFQKHELKSLSVDLKARLWETDSRPSRVHVLGRKTMFLKDLMKK